MSAASARAALTDLITVWRRASAEHATRRASDRATVYALCADQLSDATIAHLSVTEAAADAAARLQRMADVFIAAMATEGVPARQAERVVNMVLHGHPDGFDAARITGRTTEHGPLGPALKRLADVPRTPPVQSSIEDYWPTEGPQ